MKSDDQNHEAVPTSEVPVVSPVDPRVTVVGADIASEVVPLEEESILPHWTEAPTGQIPAVLSRDTPAEDDPWASIPAPAWREGEADWVAHDEQFDTSMLSGEVPTVDDTKPWEFTPEEPVVADEEILAETPRPEPSRQHRTRRPASANPLAGRAARGASTKNISAAAITGLLIAAVVIILFLIGTIPVVALIAVAVVAGAAEAYAAFRKVGVHPATLLGLVASLALVVASYNKGEAALGLVTVIFLLFSALWYMGAEKKVDILDGIGATVFVYVWIGIIGSYGALLVSPVNYPDKHGLAFLFGAIVIVVVNDVSALFIGRAIGRRPLAPTISPGKTLEGAIGGGLVSILVAVVVLPWIHPWTMRGAFFVALALAFVAPIGDLFESMVKRTLGLKDMGELLPGHGGVLDRVDGLLFALPTTYYLVHVLNLG